MFATSSDSGSDSDSEDEYYEPARRPLAHWQLDSSRPLYEPFQRNQGFFLANLAKLLDESQDVSMHMYIRWHPEVQNAMQINWPDFIAGYPDIHDTLAAYKMARTNNSVVSARASWNRKLREWNFKMTAPSEAAWTTYTYQDNTFHPGCDYYALPNERR